MPCHFLLAKMEYSGTFLAATFKILTKLMQFLFKKSYARFCHSGKNGIYAG